MQLLCDFCDLMENRMSVCGKLQWEAKVNGTEKIEGNIECLSAGSLTWTERTREMSSEKLHRLDTLSSESNGVERRWVKVKIESFCHPWSILLDFEVKFRQKDRVKNGVVWPSQRCSNEKKTFGVLTSCFLYLRWKSLWLVMKCLRRRKETWQLNRYLFVWHSYISLRPLSKPLGLFGKAFMFSFNCQALVWNIHFLSSSHDGLTIM